MRIALIASFVALTALLVVTASSYSQSFLWNITRDELPDGRDSITVVQSVVGYLCIGSFSVDRDWFVAMKPSFDPVQEGHEGLRFSRSKEEYGLSRALFRINTNYVNSKSISIHYTAIIIPLLILCLVLWEIQSRTKTKSNNEEADQVAP